MQKPITGTQRYAFEIVRCMDKIIRPDDTIEILVPDEPIVNSIELSNIPIRTVGSLKGNLWNQITFPFYARRRGGETLCIANVNPVVSPGFYFIHDQTYRRHPEAFNWKNRFVWSAVNALSVGRAKTIFTLSHFSEAEITRFHRAAEGKTVIAYCSSNQLFDNPESSELKGGLAALLEKEFFLTVGNGAKHKNQVFIYDLARLHPDKTFVIAGGFFKTFNTDAASAPANVIHAGYVDDPTLQTLYRCASGFIFPSLYEGFGLPPLEAICLGCQHVALSDIPVFRELFPDGTYLFDPYNPASFSMEGFLAAELTNEVRSRYVERYSWDRSAEAILNTIRRVAGEDGD